MICSIEYLQSKYLLKFYVQLNTENCSNVFPYQAASWFWRHLYRQIWYWICLEFLLFLAYIRLNRMFIVWWIFLWLSFDALRLKNIICFDVMNLKFIKIILQRIALLHKDCAKTDVSQVAIDNQRVTFSSTSQIIFLNYRFALSKFLYMAIHHTCS